MLLEVVRRNTQPVGVGRVGGHSVVKENQSSPPTEENPVQGSNHPTRDVPDHEGAPRSFDPPFRARTVMSIS